METLNMRSIFLFIHIHAYNDNRGTRRLPNRAKQKRIMLIKGGANKRCAHSQGFFC